MPVELKVGKREIFGSRESRRLRRKGLVPGVIYGKGGTEVTISIDTKEFMNAVGHSTASGLMDLIYDDMTKKSVIVRDVQWDSITDLPVHVDFLRVSPDQIVSVPVHVHLDNTPAGVLQGGVLEHILHEITVSVMAKDIPHNIVVDVSNLEVGDSINIGDLRIPDGVTVEMPAELVVATVVTPTVSVSEEEEEEEVEEGEEGAEEEPEATEGNTEKKESK